MSAFLARKGTRLPEAQQQAVLHLLRAAEATAFAPVLQTWCQTRTMSIMTRRDAIDVLSHWDAAGDEAQRSAVQKAGALFDELRCHRCTPTVRSPGSTPTGLLDLPIDLALIWPDLSPANPITPLPCCEPYNRWRMLTPFGDRRSAGGHPIPDSAAVLHEMLAMRRTKPRKAIKKALHR